MGSFLIWNSNSLIPTAEGNNKGDYLCGKLKELKLVTVKMIRQPHKSKYHHVRVLKCLFRYMTRYITRPFGYHSVHFPSFLWKDLICCSEDCMGSGFKSIHSKTIKETACSHVTSLEAQMFD